MTRSEHPVILSAEHFHKVFAEELHSHPILLAKIQLKNLQWINVQHGSKLGDEVIAALRTSLNGLDRSFVVGEIGPSLFGLICRDVNDPAGLISALDQAAAKLNQSNNWPFLVDLSYGVVEADKEYSEDPFVWIHRANTALIVSNREGRGRIYSTGVELQESVRLELGKLTNYSELPAGMHWVYQSVHNVVDQKLVGFEALARWDSPSLGSISPETFIQIAEELRVIDVIDRWAVEAATLACKQLSAIFPKITVSANVSAITLDSGDRYLNLVELLIGRHELAAGQLVLELTETAASANRDATSDLLGRLQKLGAQIAIDDFGKGETNLASIASLSIDFLKLDLSLLRLSSLRAERSLLRMGADIGRALGATVLAEGVETESDLALVKAAGVTLAQGYYFGKPESLDYYLKGV